LTDETRKSTVPGENAFKEALERFDLSFTFHDGGVPYICPSVDEPVWSVNIKRGILSSFQNTMPRFDINHESLDVRNYQTQQLISVIGSISIILSNLVYRPMSREPAKSIMCLMELMQTLSEY
jgi:hypothetical protein